MASSYFEKLKDPRWQKVRLKVMERDNWTCQSCGDKSEMLTVHHGLYRWGVEPWDLPLDTLWCLCEGCHGMHQDQLSDLKLEIGRTNPKDYHKVMSAILSTRD
jgi:5-methylcytosine-specific restriction endonuclease McrA